MSRHRQRKRQRRRQHAAISKGRRARVAAGASLSLGASLVTGVSAHASEVDNLGDNGSLSNCSYAVPNDCSLRGAIARSNTTDDSYIYFSSGLTGTVTLTGGQINVTDEVYIYGTYFYSEESNRVTIDANNASRIFNLDPAVAGDPVRIQDVNLANGNVTGDGGGILNVDSDLFLRDVEITGSDASGDGGALFESGAYEGGSSTRILRTTMSGNTAGDDGGAIFGADSVGTIYESTLQGNTAAGSGGAVYAGNDYYDPTLTGSTVSGNSAATGGNVAVGDNGGSGVFAHNSIIANGTATTGPDVAGEINLDSSLLENTAGATVNSYSSITGQDPQLGALQDNGGQTRTMKPALASPVVDNGGSYEYADQRGVERPVDIPTVANGADGPYDMGSVELTLADVGQGNVTVSVDAYGYNGGTGTITGSGFNCTITGGTCVQQVTPNSTVNLTATPGSGSLFGGWFGCDTPSGNQCAEQVGTIDTSLGGAFEGTGGGGGGGGAVAPAPAPAPAPAKKKKCKKKKAKKGVATQAAKKCKKGKKK